MYVYKYVSLSFYHMYISLLLRNIWTNMNDQQVAGLWYRVLLNNARVRENAMHILDNWAE